MCFLFYTCGGMIEGGAGKGEEQKIMKKIVVIEDDKTLRRALAGLLEENGYQVFCMEDFFHAEGGYKEQSRIWFFWTLFFRELTDRKFCGICGRHQISGSYVDQQDRRNR